MKKLPKMKTIQTAAKRKPPPPAKRPSSVEAHSYDPKTGHLTVTFRGGRQYRYEGVDQKTVDGLGKAGGSGSYLHRHVIGKFNTTKL